LHSIESAPVAAQAVRAVYSAMDRCIGEMRETFPDATFITVAMHGMGPNDADVAAMALLPELLYRSAFGEPYMKAIPFAGHLADGTPLFAEDGFWDSALLQAIPKKIVEPGLRARLMNRVARFSGLDLGTAAADELDWMPAARYAPFWREMPAFALPSYYDGRVRINVQGRESHGIVRPADYGKVCGQIAEMLGQCTNLLTGDQAVSEIRCPQKDAADVGEFEADLYVVWKNAPLGLRHPKLGAVGPVPYRRTGGHTGESGSLCIEGPAIFPGNRGTTSSFDVVPTILDLLGEKAALGISGASLQPSLASAGRPSP